MNPGSASGSDTPKDMLQRFDAESLGLLSRLLTQRRQAVLATLDPSGAPYTAMVAFAAEAGLGGILVHLSGLSAHKGHLLADPRCSLLVFEPDNGHVEILQHARVSLGCRAELLAKDGPDFAPARERYLAKYPGHKLMFGLGDFDLLRLRPQSGLMNAGFGRAFAVTPADLAAAG